jgi:hypothetical protein
MDELLWCGNLPSKSITLSANLMPTSPLTAGAIWKLALTLWRHPNKELHDDNGELSMEAKCKESLACMTAVYTDTIGNVSPSASLLLHQQRLTAMTNWNKQHLDAYLATAEMACE